MKVKGALVDIEQIRRLVTDDFECDEEDFRKIINSVFLWFNSQEEISLEQYPLRLMDSDQVEKIVDYLKEWINIVSAVIPTDTTIPKIMDYRFTNHNTILVWHSQLNEKIFDPITECLNQLRDLVDKATKEGGYIHPRVKQYFGTQSD